MPMKYGMACRFVPLAAKAKENWARPISQNERTRSAALTSRPGSALAASATVEPAPAAGRVGTAREEEADPRARRSGDDHDPGLQPVQQPPDERYDEARRERERRLEQRELRSGPAEVIEERGEEDAGGVVARAEDEKQGREEAADHQPGPALAARHAGVSTPAFAIGGTRTRLTWGGQGGGNSVPLGSGCRYSPLPGRYAPADAGSAASHAAEPVP